MSDQQSSTPGLRGAVDLAGLRPRQGGAQPPASPPASTSGGVPGRSGLVLEGTDDSFSEIVNASMSVASVLVLWASQIPQSREFLDTVVTVARSYAGRLQVVSIDVEQSPGLLRAFQVQTVPVTLGLVQGQPVPLFAGIQPQDQLRSILDELLQLAVQHGVTGRVDLGAEADAVEAGSAGEPESAEVEQEAPLPPLHQAAYDAIEEGDLDAAAAAYTQALAQDPADSEAQLGLAQVGLMQRTHGVDPQTARSAAAEHPSDVAAQTLVADLDILGGHVEDAFVRLIDLVKATGGDEREQARAHLLQLFALVGAHDERVRKARTALMSALF